MSDFDKMMNEIDELRKRSDNFISFFQKAVDITSGHDYSKEKQEKLLEYITKCSENMKGS